MKKLAALALGLLLCLTAMAAGDGGDPLISLSYLEGAFSRSLESALDLRLDAADQSVRAGLGLAAGGWEYLLKEGDVLSGTTGLTVTPLGGGVRLELARGAVVDVTEGVEVPGGRLLQANHRYLVAEDAAAAFTAASPAAAVFCEGGVALAPSPATDYYAIARALREAGLFRGTGTGFGEGFDLHLAPSRGEGLVLFLRLLGEEEQALRCAAAHPFSDVPGWLDRYAAWAYERGYTNGVAPGLFGGGRPISAEEFVEFLLRALGYSAAGADDCATSLERAVELGALTGGEYALLREGPFLRAHAAYLSYYSLDTPAAGGGTLARRLLAAGQLTEERLAAARTLVDSERIIEPLEPSADTRIG